MKKLYCSLRAMFTGLYSSLGLISGSGFFLCVCFRLWELIFAMACFLGGQEGRLLSEFYGTHNSN